jgi:SPX domain protein involved in polyphosphate accumulation
VWEKCNGKWGEKPMKDFIAKLQKDLNKLQKTIQQEGNDLVASIKKATTKKNIEAQAKELEHIIVEKLKTFEPAMENLYKEVRKNAEKAGIDLTKLEKEIKKKTAAAKVKLGTLKKKSPAKNKASKAKATKAKPVAKKTSKKKKTASQS